MTFDWQRQIIIHTIELAKHHISNTTIHAFIHSDIYVSSYHDMTFTQSCVPYSFINSVQGSSRNGEGRTIINRYSYNSTLIDPVQESSKRGNNYCGNFGYHTAVRLNVTWKFADGKTSTYMLTYMHNYWDAQHWVANRPTHNDSQRPIYSKDFVSPVCKFPLCLQRFRDRPQNKNNTRGKIGFISKELHIP